MKLILPLFLCFLNIFNSCNRQVNNLSEIQIDRFGKLNLGDTVLDLGKVFGSFFKLLTGTIGSEVTPAASISMMEKRLSIIKRMMVCAAIAFGVFKKISMGTFTFQPWKEFPNLMVFILQH